MKILLLFGLILLSGCAAGTAPQSVIVCLSCGDLNITITDTTDEPSLPRHYVEPLE